MVSHVLSFDVENWFDGNLHRRWTGRLGETGAATGDRLPAEVDAVLSLLSEAGGVKATFFVLGSVAAAHPEVVRRLADGGHEIGCHGMEHDLVREVTPVRYLEGLRRARGLLQELSGQPVAGHRAPSWSIDRRVPWAVAAVIDAGFSYDSSVFPARTPLYGEPSWPAEPFWLATSAGKHLLELPPAVLRLGPLSLPYGGGLYWRVLPFALVHLLLRRASSPRVTYLHPWELNPEPAGPLPAGIPFAARAALHWGVKHSRGRLRRLLSALGFQEFRAVVGSLSADPRLPTVTLRGLEDEAA